MRSPRISVVVPVYNGELTIEQCIDSVLSQRAHGYEIELILVDNASTDGTPSILNRYRDRATVLHETTRGPSAARNRGVSAATGQIIAFTDADCVADRDWLLPLVEPLKNDRIGIAGGTILATKPCNAIEEFGERIHDHRLAIECDSPPYAITMNWASPKSVLDSVGLFDEDLLRCEDCDLAYRIVAAGYEIVHVPDAVVYHRNERDFTGLMAEGYAHGYHSVALLKKHEGFVRNFSTGSARKPRPPLEERDAIYWEIFDLGKATGKAVASLPLGVAASNGNVT